MGILEFSKAHRKRIGMAGLTIVLLIFSLFLMTRNHWWRKISSATVTCNDRTLGDSQVYQSKTGDILICLEGLPDERRLYILYIQESRVGLPNENQFFFLPGYVYSKTTIPPVVFMGTAKAEADPNLMVDNNVVAFTTLNGKRVNVAW